MEYKAKTTHTPEQALFKIKNWCAYQERSQNEVRQKLYEYKLEADVLEEIVAALIAENFLNEERFAQTFTSGKFRIKQWGKIKIKMELRKHKISDYSINKALKSIDGNEYEKTIIKTIEKKLRLTKSTDRNKRFYGTLSYLASRGFESDLVTEQLNKLLQKD